MTATQQRVFDMAVGGLIAALLLILYQRASAPPPKAGERPVTDAANVVNFEQKRKAG